MKYTYITERKNGCLTGQKQLWAPWSLNKTEDRKQRSNFTFIAFPPLFSHFLFNLSCVILFFIPPFFCFFFISAAFLRCHFHYIFQLIIGSRWSGAVVYCRAAQSAFDYFLFNRLSTRAWWDTLWCHRYCILSAAGENAWWRSCEYEEDGEGASMDGWKI